MRNATSVPSARSVIGAKVERNARGFMAARPHDERAPTLRWESRESELDRNPGHDDRAGLLTLALAVLRQFPMCELPFHFESKPQQGLWTVSARIWKRGAGLEARLSRRRILGCESLEV